MKTFASHADLKPKKIRFRRLSKSCWAFTAEGDPNSGVIVGDDGVMVVDAQATPSMAREVIRRIRRVTSKPIQYVVLSHYHAVRVLGASASLMMGRLEVRILHPGPGHTGGDSVVWVPSQRVLFSGDLVEYQAGIYTGDAHLQAWPATLDKLRALKPRALVPGRGPALTAPAACDKAIRYTRDFIRGLYACARRSAAARKSLKQVYRLTRRRMDPSYGAFPIYEHCMPFDVSRAYDEARGIKHPRIWTAKRDLEMWHAIA